MIFHLISVTRQLNDETEDFVIAELHVGFWGRFHLGLNLVQALAGAGHAQEETDVRLAANVDARICHDGHDGLCRVEIPISAVA